MNTLQTSLDFEFYLPNDVKKSNLVDVARVVSTDDNWTTAYTYLYPDAPERGYVSFTLEEVFGDDAIVAQGYDGEGERIVTAAVFAQEDKVALTERAYELDAGFQWLTYHTSDTAIGFVALDKQPHSAIRSWAISFVEKTIVNIEYAHLLNAVPDMTLNSVRYEPWDAVPAIRASGTVGGYPFHFHYSWHEEAMTICKEAFPGKDSLFPLYKTRTSFTREEPSYDKVGGKFLSVLADLRSAPVRWTFSVQSDGVSQGDFYVFAPSLDEAVAAIEEELSNIDAEKAYSLTKGSIERAERKNEGLRPDGFR